VALGRDEWHAFVPDAHPGYIDLDEFERNEQQLRRSALAYGLENRRSPPREGPALLQGLVVCGVCGGRMTVRYHHRGDLLVPDYQCITGRMHRRQPLCQVIPGASIDRAVGERLIAAMTPTAIELTLSVRAELQTRLDEADRLRMQQVERAQHEVQLAQRRYMQVDPNNRLVAGTLEADWNEKLRALAQTRDEAERQRAADRATLDETMEERIRTLAHDFPAVWNDTETSHRDKKRMAQLLLEDVTLVKTDRLHVHIRFKGGAVESLALSLPENAWRKRLTHPDVVARVAQLIEQHDEAEVVEQLNVEGLCTGAGRPFDKEAVRWVRYTHGLKTPNERLRDSGKLTVQELAARLGLPDRTVRCWARDGRLRAARKGAKPTWLMDPIEQQSEHIRQLAAQNAQRAQPKPPTKQQKVELTTPEIAVRLGVGISTAHNWARAGRLRAERRGNGLRPRWVFNPIEQQPREIRELAANRAIIKRHHGMLSDAAAGRGVV
jgi:excisionase family DNA binding protein